MDFNSFSRQVTALSRRLSYLLENDHSIDYLDSGVVSTTFKELGVAIEELEVAVEEINHQNESLALSVGMVEEERSRYENLFRFAPQAYMVTDLTGQIQEVNLATAYLLDLSPDFLIGKPLVLYVNPESRPTFWVQLKQRRERDYYQEWELHLESRNPNVTIVSCLTIAIRNREGQPIGFHWTLRDITEQKRLKQLELTSQTLGPGAEGSDLLQAWPLHTFSSGEVISLPPQTLWYVQEGLVKLTTLTDQNKEVMLGLVGPGKPFGSPLTALSMHEATAVSDVKLYCISTSEVFNSPQLAQHLFLGMRGRLQQTELLLAISGELNAEKRLWQLLNFLKEEVGTPVEQGVCLNLRLTHEDFASACSTTRVTVTRSLGKFQEEGKIGFDDKSRLIMMA